MMVAPVLPVSAVAVEAPVTIRPIGTLDRVLVDNLSAALAGLAARGAPAVLLVVRDLVAARGENLDRFLAALAAYRAAGHRVMIEETQTWRKIARGRGPAFEPSTPVDGLRSRRQIIICYSIDRRARGAA